MKYALITTRISAFLFVYIFTSITMVNAQTFSNPILPSGADPFSVFVDGYYYYTQTRGNRIDLWKTRDLSLLATAEHKTIWTPPDQGMYSKHIWAPEIHFLEGKWYVYFAADDGNNKNHRMYVIENSNKDPFSDNWNFKGRLATSSDKWAIDGNVFLFKEHYYMIWSGWEDDENGTQHIYISKMKNPTEMKGKRYKIASPTYDWERYGELNDNSGPDEVFVNEGPQFLQHQERIFIVFSASGCWTDQYSLGVLEFTGEEDLLNPSHWKKHKKPLLTQSKTNNVYGTGHNSFFKSPDGKEDWILYHANSEPGQGCGGFRSPRMQPLIWDENGFPVVGEAVSETTILNIPSR